MSESLIYNQAKALYNNTFDFNVTEINNIKAVEHSYNYLSRVQRALVNNHVPITIEDEYAVGYDKKLDVRINVPYNLIHPQNRNKYRLSEYYNHTFNMNDITNHPDIFRYIPIIVVNGSIVKDYMIKH